MDDSQSRHYLPIPLPSPPSPDSATDENEDVLRYLEFSDPDFDLSKPLALPLAPPADHQVAGDDPLKDLSLWDFSGEPPRPEDEMPPEARSAEEGAADWVPPGAELDCSDCVVLREVVHSDGLKNMRLRIHGNVGKFYHATLDVNYNVDGFPPAMEQAYIDLSKQSFEWVKKFLIDYGLLRLRDKYALEHDSISAFFDALCVRMSYDAEPSTSQGKLHVSFGTGLCQPRPALYNDRACRTSKTGIAAQRERTGKLHIKDLADYFHLPISEAAKELRICSTALKKICRKHGMSRWPHRKLLDALLGATKQIKSIDRRISNLLRDLRTDNEQEKANTQAEIESLRAQRARICAGLPP